MTPPLSSAPWCPTCKGFDAGALEEARRAVLVVPVVSIPSVVDAVVVLLLDLHVFELRRHRRHRDLTATPPPPPPPPLSPPTCCLLPLATGHWNSHTLRAAVTGQAEKIVHKLRRQEVMSEHGNVQQHKQLKTVMSVEQTMTILSRQN